MTCTRCKSPLPTVNGFCTYCLSDLRDQAEIDQRQKVIDHYKGCIERRAKLRKAAVKEARLARMGMNK